MDTSHDIDDTCTGRVDVTGHFPSLFERGRPRTEARPRVSVKRERRGSLESCYAERSNKVKGLDYRTARR